MNSGSTQEQPTEVPNRLARSEQVGLPPRVRAIVIYGGQSAEHPISRITAAHVLAAMDPDRYEVVPVAIGRDGSWQLASGHAQLLGKANQVQLPEQGLEVVGPTVEPLTVLSPTEGSALSTNNGATTADIPTVAIPLLHGPNGEDGTIQGLFELADIAYVGSGVVGSAVAMDKAVAKELTAAAGIPQARWRTVHERDVSSELLADIVSDLGLPVFVKPANLGSSVGISKAQTPAELEQAVRVALDYDETLVIEETVTGREIEIGVLGNEILRCSVPGEIVPGAEFYDFDDKYRDGSAELHIPAPLSDEAGEALPELARRAFRALRCADLARVDFFYEPEGRGFLLNEINTMPGFTPISMYPQMWQATGLAYGDLIDELVRLALERHAHRGRRRR